MNELIQFEDKTIRKIWYNEQFYYAIIDIVSVLADTENPRQYWTKVKNNLLKESQLQPFWLQLKMKAADGKNYKTDCANTEGVLRIIMSIPSPKAEPFKQWLTEQGKRTIDEINDPELLTERQAEYYRLKGYSAEWIERRMQTIQTRKELTDEWQKRGVKQDKEFSILTATIAKGTFGITPSEHAKLKGLEKENLRDHMTPLELIFTALGEELTRDEVVRNDAQNFNENHEAAVKGGTLAGKARNLVETERGQKVVSTENYKHLKEGEKDKLIE